jgi:DNA-binding NarL/FixJ family response regulator
MMTHLRDAELHAIDASYALAPIVDAEAIDMALAFLARASAGEDNGGASQPSVGSAGLTMREIEVIKLVAQGHTNERIAEELNVSLSTVGHHVSNILRKTDTANRTEAASYAYRQNLL